MAGAFSLRHHPTAVILLVGVTNPVALAFNYAAPLFWSSRAISATSVPGPKGASGRRMVPNLPDHAEIRNAPGGELVPTPERAMRTQRSTRRVNRPGFNSYLKVDLDDDTIERLRGLAEDVQRWVGEMGESSAGAGLDSPPHVPIGDGASVPLPPANRGAANSRDNDVPLRPKQKRPLSFRPRSRESLHLTLFFGGETLCKLPREELEGWHSRVSDRLSRSGFCLTAAETSEGAVSEGEGGSPNHRPDFSFRVDGLVAFPPQRNNLVVAILDGGPEWHELHGDLRSIAQDESLSTALSEATKHNGGERSWVAHVTLGDLHGGSKRQYGDLNPLLQEVFHASSATSTKPAVEMESPSEGGLEWRAFPDGISMGGPMPEQMVLDWDFKNERRPTRQR